MVPLFRADARCDLVRMANPLGKCETELRLLAHPESRDRRGVAAVRKHLAAITTMPKPKQGANANDPAEAGSSWAAVDQPRLRRAAAAPSRPRPTSASVAGSGTDWIS